MKKALSIGIFSLLAIAPFHCARAQNGNNNTAAKGVEKASAGVGATADERKVLDAGSEAAVGETAATNQTLLPTVGEPTAANSDVLARTESEARRNYNAGVALYDSGKLSEAISAFKEANKLKPNDPQTQYMLGMVYWKAKAYNDAADSFKRAVRFKPDWAEAHFRLGLTYYVLGRKSRTDEAYKKLLELNSPLANRLYRINNDANSNSAVENLKAEPGALNSKQVEVVPVSTAAAAPTNEKPSRAVSEGNNLPTGVVSSNSARETPAVTRPANGHSASSNYAPSSDDLALTGVYRVGAGDVLDIRLLNTAATRSTLYSVTEGGSIDFPIAGGLIPVAGLTTKEIQTLITSKLKRLAVEAQTQVTVGMRHYASHTVIVTGLVSSPGTKILRREAIPLYVLLAEVQPRLDAARAAIMRAGSPTHVVDLSDQPALSFIVKPGDVINLTARPQDYYYIGGRISYPGQKVFQPGITLIQAILAAGGLARDNVVELSREGSDGHLATTKFNLKEIKSGKIQDPKLQPGDRIEVFR